MLWVTMTIVVAARSQSRSSSRSNRSRVSASRALNGSSSSSTCGSSASARASATRWLVPPDSSAGRDAEHRRVEADEVGQLDQARGRAARAGQPASSSGYVMLSAADRHGSSRGSWKTSPIRGSGPWIGAPSRRDRAASPGASKPGDDPQERRLATAVWPDQRDDAATGDPQVDAVEGRQPAARRGSGTRSPDPRDSRPGAERAGHRDGRGERHAGSPPSGRRIGAVAGYSAT